MDFLQRKAAARKRWPSIYSIGFFPGDQVHMQMGDGLAGAFFTGVEQIHPIIATVSRQMTAYPLQSIH